MTIILFLQDPKEAVVTKDHCTIGIFNDIKNLQSVQTQSLKKINQNKLQLCPWTDLIGGSEGGGQGVRTPFP